jgi:hypothetical protein
MTKKKHLKMTAEEQAERAYWRERIDKRIAERLAMEREEEERRARAAESWLYRLRLRVARAIAPS